VHVRSHARGATGGDRAGGAIILPSSLVVARKMLLTILGTSPIPWDRSPDLRSVQFFCGTVLFKGGKEEIV
jgi:hypothetical protein